MIGYNRDTYMQIESNITFSSNKWCSTELMLICDTD